MIVVNAVRGILLVGFYFSHTLGCSPVGDWVPLTLSQLADRAEIVLVGTVHAVGNSAICNPTAQAAQLSQDASDGFGESAALIHVDCLLKGDIECASGSLEQEDCFVTSEGYGPTSACLSPVFEGDRYYLFLASKEPGKCSGMYNAKYSDIHGAVKDFEGDDPCRPIPPSSTSSSPRNKPGENTGGSQSVGIHHESRPTLAISLAVTAYIIMATWL